MLRNGYSAPTMEKMKALVKSRPECGLWMEEVPVPKPERDEVLIRVKKTAICGTDLHIYHWDEWSQKNVKPGTITGHEFVGEIVEIGDTVKGYEPGELVSGEGHIVCGHCRNCRAGREHNCNQTQGVGIHRHGAFAEYICIPARNLWPCDPNIDTDILAIFDPFGNATHSALSFPLLGEDVLITGAGPIGIMAVAIARHAGARHVVITDLNPYRLELAKKMGATRAVNVREQKIKEVMNELGMKEGFDVGLEMSGNAQALSDMISNMFHGGKIAMLGIQAPQTAVDWNTVVFNMLTIKGIYGREMYETWYKMTVMIQSGLDISSIITHRLPAEEFQKGFDLMESGNSGKVILKWEA